MTKYDNLSKIITRNLARALDRDVLVQVTLTNGTVVRGTITTGVLRRGVLESIIVHRRSKRALRVAITDLRALTIINV